jgi:hypothetical protein
MSVSKEQAGVGRSEALGYALWQMAMGMWRKTYGWMDSYRWTQERATLTLGGPSIRNLWRKQLADPLNGDSPQEKDADLAMRIKRDTALLNRNNVTRTHAYWKMFHAHPELHWALLAHLVSRNGGWSMTDLRGEWLPGLLDRPASEAAFLLLESCNSLIFRDAYPQLLLYEESRKRGESLFRLLSLFNVSKFMRPFWEIFRLNGDPVPLTVALIVNEQNYIQKRVVDNGYFRTRVLDTGAFRSQPLLQLNQVVFPLAKASGNNKNPPALAGRVLERFDNLQERIEFGKSLYAMLFGYPRVLRASVQFADTVLHTGSRADYWPTTFGEAPGRWKSPTLAEAWPDQHLPTLEADDWFMPGASDEEATFAYFDKLRRPRIVDITREHKLGQRKLQAAVLALSSLRRR